MNKGELQNAVNLYFGLGVQGKPTRKQIIANTAVDVFCANVGKMSAHEMLEEIKYTMGVNFIVWWLIKHFAWQVIVFLFNKYYNGTNL